MVVFWDVDTQKDFMNKEGALYIPDAEKIKPVLKDLTQFAIENDILILGSVDRHFEDDEELKAFPPHCMNKTDGQKKIPETSSTNMAFISSKIGKFGRYEEYSTDEINIYTRCHNHILFEKQGINVFTNRNVIKFLDKLRVSDVVIYGVALDICVKEAVLELRKLGINVNIVTDAVKGLNWRDSIYAGMDFMYGGAKLIISDNVWRIA